MWLAFVLGCCGLLFTLLHPLQLKLRNMVTTQQERVIGEREGALDKLRLESEAVKVTMARKDEEVCGVILEIESRCTFIVRASVVC